MNALRRQHNGFSIVELMVALVISSFLVIGIIQAFMGSRLTYQTNEAVDNVQESGRFAIEILSRHIRMAGFRAQPLSGTALPAVNGRNNVTAGGTDVALAGSDKLILVYEGDGLAEDCAGSAILPGSTVTTVFLINENRELRCSVNPGNVDTVSGVSLITGVSDMQILYGERTVSTATNPPSESFRYVTANNVTTWSDVVSVRIDLTVDSVDSIGNTPFTDSYTTTVTIRNRI